MPEEQYLCRVNNYLQLVAVFRVLCNCNGVSHQTNQLDCPLGRGGAGDIIGRTLAETAKKELGQPIIVENKPGAGGNMGATLILTKPPDGYTIGTTSTNALVISYHTGLLNFHPVNHIMRIAGLFHGIVVRADSPWKTIQEFIKYSKDNPQKVSYGSPGITSATRLAMEELASMAGDVKWVHLPLKEEAETNANLLGGHVDAIANSRGGRPLSMPESSGCWRCLARSEFPVSLRFRRRKNSGMTWSGRVLLGSLVPKESPSPSSKN